MLMTIQEYAAHRGFTYQAVQHALKVGRIQRTENGLIDPADADPKWIKKSHLGRPRRNRKENQPVADKSLAQSAQAAAVDDPKTLGVRGQKDYWDAQLRELRFHERTGELIEKR